MANLHDCRAGPAWGRAGGQDQGAGRAPVMRLLAGATGWIFIFLFFFLI